jgi:hypothetical protein
MKGVFIVTFVLVFTLALAQSTWLVGSASNSVLPTVNGNHDYVKEPSENDAEGPGVCVPSFDQGPIKVGNGQNPAQWVRDFINVTVVTLRTSNTQTLIITSANLYMIFKNDWEVYYSMVRKELGTRFGELKFIAHADHNHHGPDTAGTDPFVPINRKWFEFMLATMVRTTVEAISREKRAILEFAERDWAYGMVKNRDPNILDKGLRVIQAKSVDRREIIATIVQWTNHPEVTLGMSPTVPREDCERLGKPNCSATDRYFTSDFVGVMARRLKKKWGSDVLFLNGAVGLLIAPLRANVWEVTEACPIRGDGEHIPQGCTALPKNFRKTFLIGRELANAIEGALQKVRELPAREFHFKTSRFFTRVTNIKFRAGAAVIYPGNRGMIGYSSRHCYICSNHTHPDESNCVDDKFENTPSFVPLIPLRKGEYFDSITNFVDFGPIKWLTAPAEIPPELFVGFPSDFLTNTSKYYKNPRNHAVGADYKIPGWGRDIMKCTNDTSCWIIGLGGDELGYMVPISDYRLRCLYTNAECDRLPMTYKNARSMSGEECRWVIENIEEATRKYGKDAKDIIFICQNGLIMTSENHYEETNGLGWNLARDWIRSVEQVVRK